MSRTAGPAGPRQGAAKSARFVTGSTMRHVLVMTTAVAAGLSAVFAVDLANIYFLSLLGDESITAAAGFASTVMFLLTSVGIGLSIAAAALVARSFGAGESERARELSASTHVYAVVVSSGVVLLAMAATPLLLGWLGAAGRTEALAERFLSMTLPSVPLLVFGMCAAGVLRGIGDARRSMMITLYGGIANALLDPLLIFGAGLGMDGAALAIVLSRLILVTAALHSVGRVHGLLARPSLTELRRHVGEINTIAMPAVLTNLATPIANSYVTSAISGSGDSAVAGWAVIGRLIPVAFAAMFALTAAIGPIVGQNYGARLYGRLGEALGNALIVTAGYVAIVWAVLALFQTRIVGAFGLTGEGAELVSVFCLYLAPLFGFLGALFVANAAFNNLGKPHLSTILNWSRATIGTVPLVELGRAWHGAIGAATGSLAGTVLFGTLGVALCYRLIGRLGRDGTAPRA